MKLYCQRTYQYRGAVMIPCKTNKNQTTLLKTRPVEQLTKEMVQRSTKITTLDNNTAEVKQDVYYSEIQTRTSCNSDTYESIDDQAVIPTNCALPHLNNICKNQITVKGRRGKHLASFLFGCLLVGVIAGTSMFLLLKNNGIYQL